MGKVDLDKLLVKIGKTGGRYHETRTTNVVRNAGCARSRYTLNYLLFF